MMGKKTLHYAWIILLIVCIIRGLGGGGLNTSGGLFLTPVSNELSVGVGQLSLYFSISSIVMLIWLPFAGKLINKYDIRWIVVAAGIMQAGSFIALGFMTQVWAWYLWAIPMTMGGVLIVNLLGPVLINRWFADKMGMAVGIMMAAVGLIGAIIQPIITTIINDVSWRAAYWLIGSLTLVIIIVVGGAFLRSRPKDKGLEPFGQQDEKHTGSAEQEKQGVDVATAKKTGAFYLLLMFIIALTGFSVFGQHISTFGLNLGYSLKTVGMAMSIWMLGSLVGSLCIGLISDRMGTLTAGMLLISTGAISVVIYMAFGGHIVGFTLANFLHGIASSGVAVLAPLLTIAFFGAKDYDRLYANVITGAPIASIVLMPAYGFIYDHFDHYHWVLVFLMILMLISFVGLFLGWKRRPLQD